ncbi:MAG: outer membrane protein assembly factor BamA [Bdellovibrionaceae bacterium]|nr:outer membrane protein assembly factor BamA [Pseudobdellovibrionaceae bacterium]
MDLCLLLVVFGVSTASAQTASSRKPAPKAVKKSVAAPVRPKKPKAPRPAPAVVPKGALIRQIDVAGNRKLEKDAVLVRLTSKAGEPYSAENVREDVLSLFRLGYFNDIQVERQMSGGQVDLTYRVLEKPSVLEIVFEGNSEVKAEELLETSGLKAYEILNQTKVREAVEKLQKFYEDKGYFLAKIDVKVEDLKKDESVKIVFNVREGEKVKVKKIMFIGNKKMSDSFLRGRMFTQEEGYFSGLSGSGAYKQEAFERDVVALRFAYFNQGYIQAKVDRPQVSVTPDKKGIYLTIRVEEGSQYFVGEVDFAGDLLFPKAELFETVRIDENGVFAYDVLQRDLSELQAKYGDLGYAYTNVIPRWQFNEAEKKVNLVFEIDKGNKVYFGRIDMTGNTKTRDKVIRRELKIREGELYNETRRRQSLENVQRLGFFDDVNFKSSTPPNHLDVMNIEIVVKERNTGQVQVSAGYGTSTGFTFGGSVQQTNFLGKGQNLGVSLNIADEYQVYDLSFTDPYFNDTEWSLGFRVFQSANSGRLDYDEKRTGASVSLGHPITENTRAYLSYGYTATRLSEIWVKNSAGNWTMLTDLDVFPLSTASGDSSTITGSLEYDTRNDRFRPSKGIFARASAANTGFVGGNLKYYRTSADLRFFRNIFWDVVWRNSMSWAKIGSVDNEQDPPFNELYLLGGPYSLRGYRYGRVGKRVLSNKLYAQYSTPPYNYGPAEARERAMRFFGGQQQLQYQTELQFPLIKEAEMYGVVFYDIGQAEDNLSESQFYSDWGLGLRWFSPIGPLRFEWGFPFKRDTIYHDSSVFEFSIGTPF